MAKRKGTKKLRYRSKLFVMTSCTFNRDILLILHLVYCKIEIHIIKLESFAKAFSKKPPVFIHVFMKDGQTGKQNASFKSNDICTS